MWGLFQNDRCSMGHFLSSRVHDGGLGLKCSNFLTPPASRSQPASSQEECAPEKQEWTDAWMLRTAKIQLLKFLPLILMLGLGPTASA